MSMNMINNTKNLLFNIILFVVYLYIMKIYFFFDKMYSRNDNIFYIPQYPEFIIPDFMKKRPLFWFLPNFINRIKLSFLKNYDAVQDKKDKATHKHLCKKILEYSIKKLTYL